MNSNKNKKELLDEIDTLIRVFNGISDNPACVQAPRQPYHSYRYLLQRFYLIKAKTPLSLKNRGLKLQMLAVVHLNLALYLCFYSFPLYMLEHEGHWLRIGIGEVRHT